MRGEVIIGTKEFDQLNRELSERGDKTYANPRNLTGGTIRQLDPRLAASRPLDLYVHSVGKADDSIPASHHETLEKLESFGLRTLRKHTARGSLDDIVKYYATVLQQRDDFPLEMDGIVIKVDDQNLQQRLGFRSKSPRWAIAYKFPARQATTKIEKISVQVGRNGTLTPVATLAPVPLSGVTITSATLHNRDEIERLGVAVGDTVLIERAGDVIPKVVKVVKKRRAPREVYAFPQHCPVCETEAVSSAEEVAIRCPNPRCPGRLQKLVEHLPP